LGFSREDSARFSFLLGAPVMLGAVVLDFKNILASIGEPVFYIGFLVSFIVGYMTIAFLLAMLRKYGFGIYAVYRIVLGVVVAVLIS
jgi:undecaprenyl-diphosphatase